MTTLELVQYYANLLILQYIGKPKAYATIEALASLSVIPTISNQDIVFSDVSASGSFTLSYNGNNTASINWNDSAATIQAKLHAVSGLGSVTVSGSIASKKLTVVFTGVVPPASLLTVSSNTLQSSTPTAITLLIEETDITLPLAVQNGFNVIGDNPAVGVQLDVIGKYAGVVRNGFGPSGPITLDDADFLSLIQMAIIKNNSGSSLSDIQSLIHEFFNGEILVFDYQNMQMSYLISTTVGSLQLAELFVIEGVLPAPMGVQVAVVIYAPDITNFFGFRTYQLPAFNATPFNSYTNYHMDWPWLSYADAIHV